MNLSDIRTRVRSMTNIRSSALLPDSLIDEAVNEFNRWLFDEYDWPLLVTETTIAAQVGVTTYSLPSATTAVLQVAVRTDGFERTLRAVEKLELDTLDAANNQPELYAVDLLNLDLHLYPTPVADENLTVTYKTVVADLANSNDEPAFPDEFHMAWVYAAAGSVLAERAGDQSRIVYCQAKTSDMVRRMRNRYLFSSDREPRPTPRRWR